MYWANPDTTHPVIGAKFWLAGDLEACVGLTEATHINLLELQAVTWAITTLDLRDGLLHLFVDSQVVYWLLRNWHTGSEYLLPALRECHALVAERHLGLQVQWVRSANNPADYPSRLEVPLGSLESVRPQVESLTPSVDALLASVEEVQGSKDTFVPFPDSFTAAPTP